MHDFSNFKVYVVQYNVSFPTHIYAEIKDLVCHCNTHGPVAHAVQLLVSVDETGQDI